LTVSKHRIFAWAPALATGLAIVSLAGCGKEPAPPPADTSATNADAAAADAAAAAAAREADIAAKEKDLADQQAALQQQQTQLELERRQAEAAKQQADAARQQAAAAKRAAAKPAATQAKAAPPPPPPPPQPIMVPAGTALAVELTSAVSTKTAAVGTAVQGRLASDLMVGGQRAAPAGATVTGKVTDVVSGSKKIGGTPTLGLVFDRVLAANGEPVAISARFVQQAASDTGKDTAKVLGAGAAGAVIGHQVSHKNGAIVGGILGGAAGLAIAQNTGGEVSLPSGTVLNVTLDGAVQFPPSG
jgi:hypothetical protein